MPGTPPLAIAILRRALRAADIRLARPMATRLSIAACTGAATWLFGLFQGTRYHAMLADGAADISFVINMLPRIDPVIGTILLPGLIVGGLALGGLYFSNRLA